MATIEELSDVFAGYDPNTGYVAIPPIDPASTGAELLLAGDKVTKQAFALQDFRSFGSVVQNVVVAQARRAGGVPTWVIDPLRTVFTKMPLVEGKSLVKFVGDKTVEAVQGVAEDVSEAISEAVSAVPIVAQIVKLGIRLGMFVRSQVQEEREKGPRPASEFAPLIYTYAGDVSQGTLFDGIAAGDDWTSAFLPSSDDPDFQIVRLESSGMPSVRWRAASELGHGMLPGIPDQVGIYQSIRLAAPITNGDILPSGRKFAMTLWQAAMKPSVQMFMVDSIAIESAWAGYYHALWKFAERGHEALQLSENDMMWLRARIRQSASYKRLYECEGAGNPGKIVNCQGKPPVFKPESVIDGFSQAKLAKKLGNLTGLYSDIVTYVCKVHRERARAALDTLWVAYIPSDAPLLRADPALAQRHTEARKLLLDHKARYKVDLELVPKTTADDAEFRSDLVRSRVLADVDITAGSSKKRPQRAIPEVVPEKDRAPMPEAPPVGLPESVGSSKGGDAGVGWVLASIGGAAALAAVGVGIARRRRKR